MSARVPGSDERAGTGKSDAAAFFRSSPDNRASSAVDERTGLSRIESIVCLSLVLDKQTKRERYRHYSDAARIGAGGNLSSLIRSSRMQHTTTKCLPMIGSLIVAFALACPALSHFEAMAQENAVTPSYKIGMTFRRFIPKEPYNWRGAQTHVLTTVVWYPADPSAHEQAVEIPGLDIFELGTAARDAKMATNPARLPLIVISNGTGGSGLGMAWFGEALAKQGLIAAAVNHPGNNATEPYTVEGFALRWERTRDLSEVITRMLADSEFGSHIDPNRIGGAGFSLGGYTMIEVACGVSDARGSVHYCDTNRVGQLPLHEWRSL
jgi:hypothetical protein